MQLFWGRGEFFMAELSIDDIFIFDLSASGFVFWARL
jgi:hypothetical protein